MLTTLARAKSFIADQEDVLPLALALEMASSIIETHCKRLFTKRSYTEKISTIQEPYQAPSQLYTKLVLRQYPILSIDTFTVSGENTTDYELLPDEGILFRKNGWPRGEFIIETMYTAGFITPDIATEAEPTNLPRSLEMACILLAQTLMRAPSVTSERVGDIALTYQSDGDSLPPAVKALIGPYVSRRV
ncbi:phage gp6-like head-tail connector protein [Paenibacillus alba]|uniref:phage gp6-like head-tail connector protein n=1 Tax=Paenibacillus alba TaxID=1197127 RepID=UPI0015641A8B|nr:phage gp6-like head-tail connector protein [Paenibacillus alba]NQX68481.1 phage gp6-like head-tail connector protein [Paenibacillus alba]